MDLDKYLRIEGVAMSFERFAALDRIDLTIEKGEFVSLIGHSGCGKTTLLNLVAGLLKPSAGTILLAEREVAGPGPEKREPTTPWRWSACRTRNTSIRTKSPAA